MKGVRQFSIWAFVGALLFCGAFSADAASAVRRIYRPERSVRGNENIRLDQAIDKATTPHPRGVIVSDLHFDGREARGTLRLPREVHGSFSYAGRMVKLSEGENLIDIRE